jgi:hypothetical protein
MAANPLWFPMSNHCGHAFSMWLPSRTFPTTPKVS